MARRASREIFVKVAKTGGAVVEVVLEGADNTVEDALDAANIELGQGQKLRVNGHAADFETELKDGDRVTVSGSIKGGN